MLLGGMEEAPGLETVMKPLSHLNSVLDVKVLQLFYFTPFYHVSVCHQLPVKLRAHSL